MPVVETSLGYFFGDHPPRYLADWCSRTGGDPATVCVEHVIALGGFGVFRIRPLADYQTVLSGSAPPPFNVGPPYGYFNTDPELYQPRLVVDGENPYTGIVTTPGQLIEEARAVGSLY